AARQGDSAPVEFACGGAALLHADDPAGRRAVRPAIALLVEAGLDASIAAVRSPGAEIGAGVLSVGVRIVVVAVVALFGTILGTVPAVRRERAVLVAGAVAAVVDAVVALLARVLDAVAAVGGALGARRAEALDGELEIALARVPLGVEQRDCVDVPLDDAEARIVDLAVVVSVLGAQGDAAGLRGAEPAEVDGELSADAHPNVVVAAELEPLAAPVLEPAAP